MPRNLREVFSGWDEGLDMLVIPDISVNNLSIDSRHISSGDVFVALPGIQSHGLEFAAQAQANGAVAILSDQAESTELHSFDCPLILIPGLNRRQAELASRFYGAPDDDMHLVGITGTNGKTSVAHFIAQAWKLWRGKAGLIGTLGAGQLDELSVTEHTTPDIFTTYAQLAKLRAEDVALTAMEVSSHGLDQNRVGLMSFDVAVFTNLSHDHLDYHGDMHSYAAAKKRLFTEHQPQFAILNIADKTGRRWLSELPDNTQCLSYYGDSAIVGQDNNSITPADAPADIYANEVEAGAQGIRFRLHSPWGEAVIQSNLLGRFNVDNLLATAATLGLLGMPFTQLCHALELIQPVHGRMQRIVAESNQPLVVVDYAHTPAALKQALLGLRPHTRGQLLCVFGCGGDRDKSKRPLMAAMAEKYAEQVYLTSDNPRSEDPLKIINEATAGFNQPQLVSIEPDRATAIRLAVYAATDKDVVLIAGKGHEQYQQLGVQKIPFDDALEARLALGVAA